MKRDRANLFDYSAFKKYDFKKPSEICFGRLFLNCAIVIPSPVTAFSCGIPFGVCACEGVWF